MGAAAQILEQYAGVAAAPSVFLSEQTAGILTEPVAQVLEQFALSGGGSVATVSVIEQSALFAQGADVILPAGAKASGSGSWTPYYLHESDGSGEWL